MNLGRGKISTCKRVMPAHFLPRASFASALRARASVSPERRQVSLETAMRRSDY